MGLTKCQVTSMILAAALLTVNIPLVYISVKNYYNKEKLCDVKRRRTLAMELAEATEKLSNDLRMMINKLDHSLIEVKNATENNQRISNDILTISSKKSSFNDSDSLTNQASILENLQSLEKADDALEEISSSLEIIEEVLPDKLEKNHSIRRLSARIVVKPTQNLTQSKQFITQTESKKGSLSSLHDQRICQQIRQLVDNFEEELIMEAAMLDNSNVNKQKRSELNRAIQNSNKKASQISNKIDMLSKKYLSKITESPQQITRKNITYKKNMQESPSTKPEQNILNVRQFSTITQHSTAGTRKNSYYDNRDYYTALESPNSTQVSLRNLSSNRRYQNETIKNKPTNMRSTSPVRYKNVNDLPSAIDYQKNLQHPVLIVNKKGQLVNTVQLSNKEYQHAVAVLSPAKARRV